MPSGRDPVAARLRRQAGWCAAGGSPLYAALLQKAAGDVDVEGPAWKVLEPYQDEPGSAAVALRFMAAVHLLVLDGTLPELARHYPSTGGEGDAHNAWPPFRQALIDHGGEIRALVARPCQTNEVARSAALLGGFLEVAHRTRKPLRILELGASAGLNLRWDRYRYESSTGAWGDPDSPVAFTHHYDVPPPMDRVADVVGRKGCDPHPIDPTSEEGALALRSSVWADQLGRLGLLDGALEVARDVPVEVEAADAAGFLERELAKDVPGVATVVFHSVVMQYVPEGDRDRISQLIRDAGVFRLSLEPAETFEVRLDGELLGTCGPHGTHVRWNVDSTAQ
ncbi:MAG TPA: DUF2332 domain-containing protein [Candidatus Dormibacteraeota bacterium]|nr:DUF2332 domain-containing protein [Candidatus Dormibacteraeota bacterium]